MYFMVYVDYIHRGLLQYSHHNWCCRELYFCKIATTLELHFCKVAAISKLRFCKIACHIRASRAATNPSSLRGWGSSCSAWLHPKELMWFANPDDET